jgi:transglutaminase-like putative cysteine protease
MRYSGSLVLCLACFFPFFLRAQDEPLLNVLFIPAGLLENADAVVRSQEITFSVSAPNEAVFREKRVVTLLNSKSNYNELVLFYDDFNKIGRIRGSIYDANGKFLRDIEKNETRDHSAISNFSIYEDNRVRYLEVHHDKFPYTVVFDYEIKYRDLLFSYDDWDIQDFRTSVVEASLTVTMPEEIKLYHKSLNINLEPAITSSKGKREYQWSVKNLAAIRQEPYAPSSYEVLPQVLLSPETFEAEGYTGSMASWKNLGQFQYELTKGRDQISPALKAKVQELTAGLKTDAEKIAVLYRYLQENTRYVSVQLGIGGWQPFDAAYVEKNRYGDCKALSNFMKALLREAGIASYTALVRAGDDAPDLSADFATNVFNHMILYVPAQDTWLECTSNSAPPNYLGDFTGDREVLLITENGGQLVRTPATGNNTSVGHTVIALAPDGKASIRQEVVLHGIPHEWYRQVQEHLTPEEVKKRIQEKCPLPQAYFTRIDIKPEASAPSAVFGCDMDVPQFGSKAGKRLFLPVNPVRAFREVPPANDNRSHPVDIKTGYVETDTIVLNLPEGFSVESVPAESTTVATEFGNYSGQMIRREQERALVFVRRLEIKGGRFPAEQYAAWRNFCRDVAKADAMKVVLIQKT